MIEDLANFINSQVTTKGLQRLQRWIVSTRALSYNALVLFNVWADHDKNKILFIERLIEQQRPQTNGISVSLKEAVITVCDSSDVEPFVCTTGLERWCIRVHCTLLGEGAAIDIDGKTVKMSMGEAIKIPFNYNAGVVTPKCSSRVVQLVTFWGTDAMPRIWDATKN